MRRICSILSASAAASVVALALAGCGTPTTQPLAGGEGDGALGAVTAITGTTGEASNDLLEAGAASGEAAALPGVLYGEGVSLTEGIPISEVYARVDELEGQRVRVEGLVTDVCEKRGCWFEMAGAEDYQTLQFKVPDGVMVFPMSMKGQYAVAEGIVTRIEMSMEETLAHYEHQAAEHGTEFDPTTVTEPLTIVRLDGKGAVVRDRR